MKIMLRTMKNGFYFLGGLLLLAGACTAPDSYRLVGNLSGLADGTRMLLVPAATHKQEKPIGEAVVEDGKFVFDHLVGLIPHICSCRAASASVSAPGTWGYSHSPASSPVSGRCRSAAAAPRRSRNTVRCSVRFSRLGERTGSRA